MVEIVNTMAGKDREILSRCGAVFLSGPAGLNIFKACKSLGQPA
jgi:hypothetical protein